MLTEIREVIKTLEIMRLATVEYHDKDNEFTDDYHSNANQYDSETEDVKIRMFSWGQDYGTTYDQANIKYIEKNYAALFEDESLSLDYSMCAISLLVNPLSLTLARSDFWEELEGLDGYPTLCDDILSEVEQELLDESWEDNNSDFENALDKATGLECIDRSQEWVMQLYFSLLHATDGNPYYEFENNHVLIDIDQMIEDNPEVIDIIFENIEELETDRHRIDYTPSQRTITYKRNLIDEAYPQENDFEFYYICKRQQYYNDWSMSPNRPITESLIEKGFNQTLELNTTIGHNFCVDCHSEASVVIVSHIDQLHKLCEDCHKELIERVNYCPCGKPATKARQLVISPINPPVKNDICYDCYRM